MAKYLKIMPVLDADTDEAWTMTVRKGPSDPGEELAMDTRECMRILCLNLDRQGFTMADSEHAEAVLGACRRAKQQDANHVHLEEKDWVWLKETMDKQGPRVFGVNAARARQALFEELRPDQRVPPVRKAAPAAAEPDAAPAQPAVASGVHANGLRSTGAPRRSHGR